MDLYHRQVYWDFQFFVDARTLFKNTNFSKHLLHQIKHGNFVHNNVSIKKLMLFERNNKL